MHLLLAQSAIRRTPHDLRVVSFFAVGAASRHNCLPRAPTRCFPPLLQLVVNVISLQVLPDLFTYHFNNLIDPPASMMAQLKLQTLLLVLLMALASASPLAQHNESEILLDKRWYSIPLDKNVPPHLPRAWPLRGHKNSVRPVRYCFANEESYQALHKDLCNGIAKWVPATRQSSLVITQDIACGYVQNGKCMCDVDGVELGTLHIFVSSEDTQGATRGYNEPSKEHSHSFPPNSLRFPRRNQPPAPPDTSDTEDKTRAVLMAHELGMTRTAFLASSERSLISS